MAKSEVAVPKGDNLPTTVEEKMAAEAQALRDNLQVASSKISTQNKSYTLPDGTMVGEQIQLVIIGYAAINSMYENAEYVQGQPNPVVCCAIVDMKVGGDMIPFASSSDKQSERCGTWNTPECPMNEFGSKGKGKRCKNEYALLVCLPTDNKVMELRIPPTATEEIAKSMGAIMKEFGHPSQAIATFKFNPGKSYPLPIITTADANPMWKEHYVVGEGAMEDLLKG